MPDRPLAILLGLGRTKAHADPGSAPGLGWAETWGRGLKKGRGRVIDKGVVV